MLRTDQREDTTVVGLIDTAIRGDISFSFLMAEAKLKIDELLRFEEAGVRGLLSLNIQAELNGAH